MATNIARSSLVEDYPKVPIEELLRDGKNSSLYNELKLRYTNHLTALRNEVAKDQAKLVVVVLTPEVGKYATLPNIYGVPYIAETCTNLGIDYVDFSPDIAEWLDANPDHGPVEGNWTKEGTGFAANLFSGILSKYDGYSSPKTFPAQKPETFGDLAPAQDVVLDGEKNIPYRLTINAQGLRMNHNLTFPKKKQTILFLGDSKIYNPFIDNKDIITEVLQRKFPDKEIINAGNLQYTMEDYLTLYVDKARFTEPDLVIVCTNGGDILDYYFSQRNRYARALKAYRPTPLEKKFYQQMSK